MEKLPVSETDRQRDYTERLEKVQHQLYGYIFALLRNLDDAQEVYQQTCLAMWEKFDSFDGRSEFGTWACGFARFKVMDFRKTRRRYISRFSQAFEEQLAALQMQVPTDDVFDRREALDGCVQKLTPNECDLIRARYGEDRPVRELAAQLERSTHSVHGSLRRIREKLLECIDRTLASEGRR